jgi:hypothetical protein
MIPVRPAKALLILFGFLFLFGASQGTARGEDEEPGQDDGVTLKEGIDYPIPGPDQFLVLGHVDFIEMESGAVVVDDANYRLLPSTDYYTSVMGAGSIHLFREGLAVGLIADRKGRVQSIWLIE